MPAVGTPVLLAVTFRSSPDGPVVDPTGVTLTISLGGTIVLGPIPQASLTRVGTGRYEYEWNIPLGATPGTYTAQWSGLLPGGTAPTLGYETIHVTLTEGEVDDEDDLIVTVEDLRDYMNGIGLDANQAGALEDVLAGVQRELERYCQRRFKVRAYVETVQPDEWGRLWPKNTPVLDVLEPFGYSGVGNQIVADGGVGYGGWGPVQVKYVAGLNPDDLADVRRAILQVAAREATDRHDDTLSVRDTDSRRERRADPMPLGWQPAELARFDRLRRRTVA
jgi:hypothetical protein